MHDTKLQPFKVIVAGGREFHLHPGSRDLLWHHLPLILCNKLPNVIIVSGTQKGADQMGEQWAAENGLEVEKFYPDWSNGKRGGPERNRRMADVANALILFWDGSSSGSKSMLEIAKSKRLLIRIVHY